MSSKTPAADRSHGGPGSSHEDATEPKTDEPKRASGGHRNAPPQPNAPTNTRSSQVSGGGGERENHHTHDPATKR